MGSLDKEVFVEDCRRFFAIHPDLPEGVDRGELGIQRTGRPCRLEAMCTTVGKHWRDLIRNEISRQGVSCLSTNRYQDNNWLFQLN